MAALVGGERLKRPQRLEPGEETPGEETPGESAVAGVNGKGRSTAGVTGAGEPAASPPPASERDREELATGTTLRVFEDLVPICDRYARKSRRPSWARCLEGDEAGRGRGDQSPRAVGSRA